jgi:hypothetical protein
VIGELATDMKGCYMTHILLIAAGVIAALVVAASIIDG